MQIGLISDTHIPWEAQKLPPQVAIVLKGVDLILHAGDIYSHMVLDELEHIAPVLAALGDDDYPWTDQDLRIREKHVLEFEGLTLWLVHERPYSLFPPIKQKSNLSSSVKKFKKPDIIVFGHEHRVIIEHVSDVLFINPGSPTYLNYHKGPGTIGMLEINSGKADVHIIQL